MMTKLYRQIDGQHQYWEIWDSTEDPTKLILHWGTLGDWGERIELAAETPEAAKITYGSKVQEKKLEGFKEPSFMYSMILQFQTDDSWGATSDLDFRNEWWDHLNGILGWTGNGSVHGGDIGSGTINLYFEAVEPKIAVKSIVAGIDYMKIDKKFIIALEGPLNEQLETADAKVTVLYPENYLAAFSY